MLGCLSWGGGLLHAAPRAVVDARVVIPDTSLTRDCDPAKLAECVADSTRHVRQLGNEYFSYLDWNPGATPAAASLVFELRESPGALGSDYALVLRVSLSGGDWTEVEKLPVYAASSMSQPTGNAVKLRARLLEVLNASFQNDVFRKRLQDDNLSEIPIASEIQLAEGQNQFIVPLDSKELKVRDGSTLTAKFRVQETGGPRWATFTLKTGESDGDAPWYYNLRLSLIHI